MLIGKALDEFFSKPYVAGKVAEGRIVETWRAVVGDYVADMTDEIRLENHILHVKISSSLVRNEIFYQREALKDRINEYSKVRIVNAVIVK
ncbi:MAG: DUF721 domain-containing protein [Rikenellaceae bacterium]